MDKHTTPVSVCLVGATCMPAMTVEDPHIAGLAFDLGGGKYVFEDQVPLLVQLPALLLIHTLS